MKALVIATLLFFSLRAMSKEVGEDKKGECKFQVQSNKREAKEKEVVVADTPLKETNGRQTITK